MKNKIFLFAILSFSFNHSAVKAQNLSFGILGGPGARSFSYGAAGFFKHPDIGEDIGFLAELRFTEKFSLQPMVEYSDQGSKHGSFVSDLDYDPALNINGVKFAELNYIMVPVLAKASWRLGDRSPMRFFIGAGPYAAFLTGANQVLITTDGQKVNGSGMNVKPELNTFNAGADGNAGLSYNFSMSSVFIQAGGNYGLIKIQKNQSEGANYAGGASLTIGYSFWFDDNYLTNGHVSPRN